jgi:anaerobic ribonucleoside-triphosphate reductase activating protein
MNNGEGLRVVLWLSGCSHKCKGCQNPQTWDANSGIPFDESAKEELFRELDKDYISGLTLTGGDPFFEGNLDGVLELVTEVNKRYNTPQDRAYVKDKNNNILMSFPDKIRLSSPHKTIWIYSGYTWEEILDEEYNFLEMHDTLRKAIIAQCNVFVDGQYKESQRDITLPYRGSKNQRLIDVQQSLQEGKIVLWQI